VVVSYNRLELLERTLASYLETVTLPYSLVVVDNCSTPDVIAWLWRSDLARPLEKIELAENLYPGFAANRGFEAAPSEATLLHRSDNDMEYQPGWCEEVVERFDDPKLGQLGLRTLEEEGPQGAVGGNAVIRRELYDAGLRYGEAPWSEVPFEDCQMSQKIHRMGYTWGRVHRPCALHIGIASSTDPYYQQTFRDRHLSFAAWGVK
jgi:glycosyltransferase involved in cell wall biosynthesis